MTFLEIVVSNYDISTRYLYTYIGWLDHFLSHVHDSVFLIRPLMYGGEGEGNWMTSRFVLGLSLTRLRCPRYFFSFFFLYFHRYISRTRGTCLWLRTWTISRDPDAMRLRSQFTVSLNARILSFHTSPPLPFLVSVFNRVWFSLFISVSFFLSFAGIIIN